MWMIGKCIYFSVCRVAYVMFLPQSNTILCQALHRKISEMAQAGVIRLLWENSQMVLSAPSVDIRESRKHKT
jgi:hypothetical protein